MSIIKTPDAALDASSVLYGWLHDVRGRLVTGERPDQVEGPFGRHGVSYGEEDGEVFAVVGFCLPDGIFAEIDSDTYGTLCGFRIFLDPEGDE